MKMPRKTTVIAHVLRRARVVFTLTSLLVVLSSSSWAYWGWKTGQLQQTLLNPIKRRVTDIFDSLAQSMDEKPASPSARWRMYVSTDASSNTSVTVKQTINGTTTTYSAPSSSAQEQRSAIDVWWENVKAENARRAEESRRNLEEFRKQSEEKMQSFQQEAKQGLEDFRKESEARREEFLQNNGF